MTRDRIDNLIAQFRGALLDDIIPFWLRHAPDHEHGGFLHHLDRDGALFSTDKGIWIQCRSVWMLSKLCTTIGRNSLWLEEARQGLAFVDRVGFDDDGRMFFLVTRDGKPLRKRRYLFSEAFAAIAYAEYGRAAGDGRAVARALDIFRLIVRYHRTPGLLEPKVNPGVRPMKSHAMPMILLATAQQLRGLGDDAFIDAVAEESVHEVLEHFVRPEIPALLEHVGMDGGRLDGPAGRLVNPGHALETAWFLLHEAAVRRRPSLTATACDIIDWSLALGWDSEHGGLFSFIDAEGRPCEQLEWDMKLWWPHTEAMYALLCAARMTGRSRDEEWFERVHAWTFGHFPDPMHGEWFGYLHRDGTVASMLKGSLWKGPFHIPRALLLMIGLLTPPDGLAGQA